ncbi:MAG: DNA mismatch repair protein MutS [Planctomycetota bacterium]|nr:DNA mismatch repair protein MutS [Planctomycetota bacterium]
MSTSPMMRQYDEAKAACGDALLLFRMGDFYELFHEDAKICAKVLGLTLTSRDKNTNPIPMAGFPHHQLEGYLAKLIRHGHRVAVCDQVEDPKEAKGIVKREVTRIVTAGTLTDEALLDPLQANLLVSLYSTNPGKSDAPVGLAWTELSTGRFEAGIFARNQVLDELARLEPSEVILREDDGILSPGECDWPLALRPSWQFAPDEAIRQLCQHFGVKNLEGMGWDHAADQAAIGAAGAVLTYLQETQKTSLGHLRQVLPFRQGETLEIDAATRRSLELTHTIRDRDRKGSLLEVLDQTCTSMGSRLLANWLAAPLLHIGAIRSRHEAVGEFLGDNKFRGKTRKALDGIYDLERLLGRVATGRASPRDLKQVGNTLAHLPDVKNLLNQRHSPRIQSIEERLELCEDLRDQLIAAFKEECPLHLRDGGFLRDGYNQKLDELRTLARGGKQWIAEYQARQSEETGIPSLKVGYNKVFGYYLEVTNAHKDKVPDHFVRKQTLKNAERYITDELKQYETKVISADEQALTLELNLFYELRQLVADALVQLHNIAVLLSELDVLAGLAELANKQNYICPEMSEGSELEIIEGRHPVLDHMTAQGTFVPNDCRLGGEQGTVMLITGPNMAGKSTYIRQVALITLMAQLGSFVPASRARVGVADRIFARVGASDELSRGQSTFMVEMVETARILNTATEQSLVILDEIGRGTSTYDGLSLAWAIVEHLHDHLSARTLFATHYHELTQLEKSLCGVRNFNVAVKEWDENIVFLHRIVPGGADKSYGIHVARLAGIPFHVNERAKDILNQLEADHINHRGDSKITPPRRREDAPIQLTLFDFADHPVIDKIRDLDVSQMTPVQALQMLEQWQNEVAKSG